MPTVHAFWSYSRGQEDVGVADLHRAMQRSLADPMSLYGGLSIFRDNDRKTGIDSGSDWPRSIVEAIARSTLFFWVQSPAWLRAGSPCQFEFEAFRDRIARISDEFRAGSSTSASRDLQGALVVPIRWYDMHPEDWSQIDADVCRAFRPEWDLMQTIDELNFPLRRTRTPLSDGHAAAASAAAAAPIAERFKKALAALGTDLPTLQAFIDSDRATFEQRWLAELERRMPALAAPRAAPPTDPTLRAQARLAARISAGLTRAVEQAFGVSSVLVPADDGGERGFWAAAMPLSNRWRATLAAYGDGRPVNGPAGWLLWSAEDIAALAEPLAELGFGVPDAAQAARLLQLFGGSRDTAIQLGFQSMPRDLWFRDAAGALAGAVGGESRRPLVLIVHH